MFGDGVEATRTRLAGLLEQGRWGRALDLAQDACAEATRLRGDGDLLTADYFQLQASVLQQGGEFKRAAACLEKALKARRRKLPRGHATLIENLAILGSVLQLSRAPRRADKELAVVHGNLGLVLAGLGDWAGARDQYNRSLECRGRTEGRHPVTALLHDNRAALFPSLGDPDQARAAYQQAWRRAGPSCRLLTPAWRSSRQTSALSTWNWGTRRGPAKSSRGRSSGADTPTSVPCWTASPPSGP